MDECRTTAYVDFGDGPVKIRCTQKGAHQQCRTEVYIFDEQLVADEVIKHNVFAAKQEDEPE